MRKLLSRRKRLFCARLTRRRTRLTNNVAQRSLLRRIHKLAHSKLARIFLHLRHRDSRFRKSRRRSRVSNRPSTH